MVNAIAPTRNGKNAYKLNDKQEEYVTFYRNKQHIFCVVVFFLK